MTGFVKALHFWRQKADPQAPSASIHLAAICCVYATRLANLSRAVADVRSGVPRLAQLNERRARMEQLAAMVRSKNREQVVRTRLCVAATRTRPLLSSTV
eukprot:5197633-Pleurochrysis_carterae.AAC.1